MKQQEIKKTTQFGRSGIDVGRIQKNNLCEEEESKRKEGQKHI